MPCVFLKTDIYTHIRTHLKLAEMDATLKRSFAIKTTNMWMYVCMYVRMHVCSSRFTKYVGYLVSAGLVLLTEKIQKIKPQEYQVN